MRAFKRDSGDIKRAGTGKLGCCCCAETIDIVFSGVDGCTCEAQNGGTGLFQTTTLTDLSGPYTLNLAGTPDIGMQCTWTGSEVGSVTIDRYDTSDCSNPAVSTLSTTFDIKVNFDGADYIVTVTIHGAVNTPFVCVDSDNVFTGTDASTTVPNENASCAAPFAGQNGTATLS